MPPPPDADPLDSGEDGVDITRLGQTAAWGGLAALALFVAVLAARSETGSQRITVAMTGAPATARAAAPAAPPPETEQQKTERDDGETRRLAQRVQALSAARDRLAARLEALERTVDVTGSTRPPAAPHSPPSSGPPSSGNERVIPGVLPMPTPSAPSPSAARAANPTANGNGSRPPALVPEPATLETAPARGPAVETAEETVERTNGRTEFAIDLGAESNLEALRALWRTVKAQHGGALEGMRPLVVVRDNAATAAPELRLVVGPVINAATAARMCALIGLTGRLCQPVLFEGQRLALR